jgi:hypothetical protein
MASTCSALVEKDTELTNFLDSMETLAQSHIDEDADINLA